MFPELPQLDTLLPYVNPTLLTAAAVAIYNGVLRMDKRLGIVHNSVAAVHGDMADWKVEQAQRLAEVTDGVAALQEGHKQLDGRLGRVENVLFRALNVPEVLMPQCSSTQG